MKLKKVSLREQFSTPPAMTFHPFMRLPPELRVRIYDMVVVFDEPIFISRINREVWHSMERSTTRSGRSVRPKEDEIEERQRVGHSALAVVHTCRQVYLEAAPRYYCLNTFAGYPAVRQYSSRLEAFSVAIGPTITEMIAKVELPEVRSWRNVHLEGFEGCRTLTVSLPRHIWKPSVRHKIFREVWIMKAKMICNTLKKLERVNLKTKPQGLTGDNLCCKAVEMELNLALHARKQLQN